MEIKTVKLFDFETKNFPMRDILIWEIDLRQNAKIRISKLDV